MNTTDDEYWNEKSFEGFSFDDEVLIYFIINIQIYKISVLSKMCVNIIIENYLSYVYNFIIYINFIIRYIIFVIYNIFFIGIYIEIYDLLVLLF